MSHDELPKPPPARTHPFEEVLRLIDRDAPEPFFPAEFLRTTRADPERYDALLSYLALEGLIEKARGKSADSGAGVVLTPAGRDVLREPALMAKLVNGEALREGDVGGTVRQDMRRRRKPYLTYALIAANVAVFALGAVNPAWSHAAGNQGGTMFAQLAAVAGPVARGEWWRLLTCVFLHAGVLHLGLNMTSLYSVGSFVEQAWGRWRMLAIYFVGGWVGSCLGVQYSEAGSLVGASGAICALLAAVGVWFLLYRKHVPREFAKQGLTQVGTSFVMIAVMGFTFNLAVQAEGQRGGISNAAHLGGGLGGVAAVLALHVQRFGPPGRSPALRWAVAVALLLLAPASSYLAMQWSLSAKRPAARDDAPRAARTPRPE